MARIMKYELIKNRFRYLVMIAVMLLAEGAFLIANARNYEVAVGMLIILGLAAWGTLFIIILEGIAMYNRDLREKSGYMVFMTPLPAWQILLGKILVILAVGSALFLSYCLLAYLDLHLLAQSLAKANVSITANFAASILDSLYGAKTIVLLLRALVYLLCFVSFFVCLAYLSSTVSASLLRGKKGEKAISFFLFIGLVILVSVISSRLMGDADFAFSISHEGLDIHMKNQIVGAIIYLVSAVASFLASAYLLDKKVDI